MNEYRPDTPRTALALGALAMTTLTIAALVVAPAVFNASSPDIALARTPGVPVEVAISPARIEVVGKRAPDVAWALPSSEPCKPQG
jgi:hypothetical protein